MNREMATRSVERWKAFKADFYGIPIYLVTKDGERSPSAVSHDSLLKALDDGLSSQHRTLILSGSRREFVELDGESRSVRIVDLRTFYQICTNHPSPKLDRYREKLAEICDSVQTNGNYIEHAAGPEAYVPAELRNTAVGNFLGAISHLAVEQARIVKRVDAVEQKAVAADHKAQAAIELHSGMVDEMTIMAWLKRHRKKAEGNLDAMIGRKLGAWCDEHGIKKVYTEDRRFGNVRIYPRRILEQFIPDGVPQAWLFGGGK